MKIIEIPAQGPCICGNEEFRLVEERDLTYTNYGCDEYYFCHTCLSLWKARYTDWEYYLDERDDVDVYHWTREECLLKGDPVWKQLWEYIYEWLPR